MDSFTKAFKAINRVDFVPENVKVYANLDRPLPIGYGQTISQPTTVYMMLEWLDPQEGHKVLDVGSGSGWTTALLAAIVGKKGVVHAVERVPELLEFGRRNCAKYHLKNVTFHNAGQVYGSPLKSPFDRILVSAAANKLPSELIAQLAPGGKMVIPIQNDIHVISKSPDDNIRTVVHEGFVFVPLV